MGFHTYPAERAGALEDPSRYRWCSREELLAALDPDPGAVVADLGSGTGFYAREVAPFVGRLLAVDVQAAMHRAHREEGVPGNVDLLTAAVASLPIADGRLDAAFSVDTHHEYADEDALEELARALRRGGRLVTVDWSANGSGEDGPPLDERFAPATVADQLEGVGFEIESVRHRPETLVVVARRSR